MRQFLLRLIVPVCFITAVNAAADGGETGTPADAVMPVAALSERPDSGQHGAQAMSGQVSSEQAIMAGPATGSEDIVVAMVDREEIWVEISDAIESLNDVVGDRMFLDLRRLNQSEMQVRLDAGFWQRVRYQTRVDLKNDISNIWHLYVKQYYNGGYSSVHFIDDKTDSTIDIFTKSR